MSMVEKTRFNYELLIIAHDDPYPTYRWMRDEEPVHYSELEDVWVLTRYADCSAAFKDWQTWSSQRRGNLLNDIPERVGKTLGTTHPPPPRGAPRARGGGSPHQAGHGTPAPPRRRPDERHAVRRGGRTEARS